VDSYIDALPERQQGMRHDNRAGGRRKLKTA
jgi:hypothetical protein